MADIEISKDRIAIKKGYHNWDDMENWIINNNRPENIALLLVNAMKEVCYDYADDVLNK